MWSKGRKVPYIEQGEHSECALACAAMLVGALLEQSVTLDELRGRYGVPRGGLSIRQLVDVLSDYGIEARAVRAGKIADLGTLNVPCIVHWDNDHFVVLEYCSFGRFHIADPSSGRHVYTLSDMTQHCSGVALIPQEMTRTQSVSEPISTKKKSVKSRVAALLLNFARRSPFLILLTVVASFAIQSLALIVPTATKYLIDNQGIVHSSSFTLFAAVLLLGSVMIYYIVEALNTFVVTRLQITFGRYLFTSYMSGVISQDFSFFVNRASGDLIYRANLIILVEQALTGGLVNTFVSFVFLAAYLMLMLNYSFLLTVLTLSICALILIASLIYARSSRRLAEYETLSQSDVQKAFVEIFSGIETVKSLNLENHFYHKWLERFEKQLYFQNKRGVLSAKLSSLSSALVFVLPLVVVTFGIVLVNHETLGLGTVVGFMTLATAFAGPFSNIVTALGQFITLGTYMKKIMEVIPGQFFSNNSSKSIDTSSKSKGIATIDRLEMLSAQNVSYSYTVFDHPVISNIDFEIRYGEKVAIVGPTGSGKSTLLKLLAGLICPTGGSVLANNSFCVQDLDKTWLMNKLAFVNQDPMVFNETLRDNILMHRTWIREEQLNKACEEACIDESMMGISKDTQVMLSEHGMNLSGGQRQKVTIARALAGSPDFLLMDEPTSSLDNETERHIMRKILSSNSSCVTVAHRLVSIQSFDRIYVMNHGKIVESGTHDELIALNGLYTKLYRER